MALLASGQTYRAVAAKLGASLSSVIRWRQTHREHGHRGLRAQPIPGRPPSLTLAQKERLKKHLVKGPLAAGHSTDLWTLKRIAHLIQKRFGVTYHPAHVWKLMQALRWSWQKPERRALQRNEEAIARWKKTTWPHIKKSPKAARSPGLSR